MTCALVRAWYGLQPVPASFYYIWGAAHFKCIVGRLSLSWTMIFEKKTRIINSIRARFTAGSPAATECVESTSSGLIWRLASSMSLIAFVLAALNVCVLLVTHEYNFRLGALHLAAHGLFKPLELGTILFFVALTMSCPSARCCKIPEPARARLLAIVLLLVATLYARFINIDFLNPEWNHRHISASLNSAAAFGRLFVSRQGDGFYRPITFVSLWLDYRFWGVYLAGYHVQSILLHLINVVLVSQLALSLELSAFASAAGAALFAFAPFGFEPVLWPAARFDLLATMFFLLTLIIILQSLKSSCLTVSRLLLISLLYIAAVLSKESAYALPVIATVLVTGARFLGLQHAVVRNKRTVLVLLWSLTVIMMAVRIAIYGNLGGYPMPHDTSTHFHLSLKTVETLVGRVFAWGLLTVNLTTGVSPLLATSVFLSLLSKTAWIPETAVDFIDVAVIA